jgi:hypothetical protein
MSKAGLITEKTLIPPQHHGWSKGADGKVHWVSDERWKIAFPDCKWNKFLEDATEKPRTYGEIVQEKIVGQAL